MWRIILLCLIPGLGWTQEHNHVHGVVSEKVDKTLSPLVGATVRWKGTSVATVTDDKGSFHIDRSHETDTLEISYVGYELTYIYVDPEKGESVEITLEVGPELDAVQVVKRRPTASVRYMDIIQVENIGEGELEKAACCNLSESFETNPSVDVSFTDAVTGTRQIRLLGLSGPNTLITSELMPDVRGVSSVNGLTYVPGPWVESIQLIKGVGSVRNGYEGLAGQINVELRKPETADLFYLNGFANLGGRFELNAFSAVPVGEKWSTATLAHGKYSPFQMDRNGDNFQDNLQEKHIIAMHRWTYQGENGWRSRFGVKASILNNQGGTLSSTPDSSSWRYGLNTQRYEAFAKLGKVFNRPSTSLGMQFKGVTHRQEGHYGTRPSQAAEDILYANVLFSSYLGNTKHKYFVGASTLLSKGEESVDTLETVVNQYVPGVFAEYTFIPNEKVSLVAGIRADYDLERGFFLTPRVHTRLEPFEGFVMRIGGGRAQRVPFVLSENAGIFASNRTVSVPPSYLSLMPVEIAWNTGLSMNYLFSVRARDIRLSAEYFYTWFEQAVIVDRETLGELSFYTSQGGRWSHVAQVQADIELLPHLDLRLSYRWYDVRSKYTSGDKTEPLIPNHRALANIAYEIPDKWKFDMTGVFLGSTRLPLSTQDEIYTGLSSRSKPYVQLNAQITKAFKSWEVYVGGENLLNYRQPSPIIDASNPRSPAFDASLIYGPIFGANIYAGFRYRIPRKHG